MSIFIVAEIGINHNGCLDICKKLIDVALDVGCNAVKLQKRDIDSVYTNKFLDNYRESPWGNTQRDQKLGLEFNKEEYYEIDRYCKEKKLNGLHQHGILKVREFLKQFKCKYNKIASAMIVSKELLEVVQKNKNIHLYPQE